MVFDSMVFEKYIVITTYTIVDYNHNIFVKMHINRICSNSIIPTTLCPLLFHTPEYVIFLRHDLN